MIKHTTTAVLAGLVLAAATFGSNAATRTFSNTAPITIYDNAAASLYPAPISVSTLGGPISNVKVTLHGFSHTYIGDLNILLVSPAGQKISLLRRYGMTSAFCCGYSSNLANAEITFSASAASMIPANVATVPNGTYLPSSSGNTQDSPAPAPAGPYSSDLTTLNGPGIAQNGTWKLFVTDNAGGDVGAISGGWSLSLTGFYSCAAEGYTGTKRTLCHQVCEINYPPTTLNGLIKLWVALYHSTPPCVD
jgi:subtilisin-like proprotein convertase family protein